MRIVIADDSGHARDFAHRVLRNAGHEVVYEAKDGKEAVSACAALKPDVAVLDIIMPGALTGKDAALVILREGTARHVIMGSSSSQAAIIDELLSMGCQFVGKPYDKRRLLDAVQRCEPPEER